MKLFCRGVVGNESPTCRRCDSDIRSGWRCLAALLRSLVLYFHPGAAEKPKDPTASIVLVESEKAVLALTAWASRNRLNILPIGLGGCWGWKGRIGKVPNARGKSVDEMGPVPDLDCCDGRKVYVLLDANLATNPKVKNAWDALNRELHKRNCAVLLCKLPLIDGVNGPDDFIAVSDDDEMTKVFNHAFDARVAEVNSDWPEPEPLGGELPPVQAFDAGLLPEALRPLVEDTAEPMQVPPDYPAAVAVLGLAGVVNRRAMIQPKAADSSWVKVPNLWGGIVAPPGLMKSPLISAITKPFNAMEAKLRAEYDSSSGEYEARGKYGITGHGDMAGIVFPYFDPNTGHRVTARLRRDNPEVEDGKEKNKYISAYGDRKHLHEAHCDGCP
jgi:Protein of unknown function (DUF3987)/Domain of unknown function (DUF3854)